MMTLDNALQEVTMLGLDTSPIIYYVEANKTYDTIIKAVFVRLDRGLPTAVTSVVTLAEVLVQPLAKGDQKLLQEFRSLLFKGKNLSTLSIDAQIAEHAADLRARYRLRTPDALQIAVALNAGCQAFLTNDIALKRVTELRVLVLDELTV